MRVQHHTTRSVVLLLTTYISAELAQDKQKRKGQPLPKLQDTGSVWKEVDGS